MTAAAISSREAQQGLQASTRMHDVSSSRGQQAGTGDALPSTASVSSADAPLTAADYAEMSAVHRTIAECASQLLPQVSAVLRSLSSAPSASAGNSLYELKNHLMLQYLMRLLHVMRRRVQGQSIAAEESVDELCELRIVLERMRPIEKRIRYATDRLLSQAAAQAANSSGVTQQQQETDPRAFRPNPLDLLPASAVPDAASASAMSTAAPPSPTLDLSPSLPSSAAPDGVYRPPHHISTLPTGAASGRAARVRSKLSSSSFIRSLVSSMSDAPEELRQEGAGVGEMNEPSAEDEQRREYEERMMVRLVDTREDKRRRRQRERQTGLQDVDDYDDLREFIEGPQEEQRGKRRRTGQQDAEAAVDDLFDGVERGPGGKRSRGKTRTPAGGGRGSSGAGSRRKGRGGKKR